MLITLHTARRRSVFRVYGTNDSIRGRGPKDLSLSDRFPRDIIIIYNVLCMRSAGYGVYYTVSPARIINTLRAAVSIKTFISYYNNVMYVPQNDIGVGREPTFKCFNQ